METEIFDHPDCNIRLQTLSLIRTSINLWELPNIKTGIQNYFLTKDEDAWNPKTWHKEMTQKVLDVADTSIPLPSFILAQLKDAILNTGVKIYNWILCIHSELGLNVSYAEKILWTPFGRVDEKKIFKSGWENDPSLYEGSPVKPIFSIACWLVQEDFIEKHQKEIAEELKNLQVKANLCDIIQSDEIYSILTIYFSYYIKSKLDKEEKKDYYNVDHESFVQFTIHEGDFFFLEARQGFSLDEKQKPFHYKNVKIKIYDWIKVRKTQSPDALVKFCALFGLVHGFKYNYEKLNSFQKNELNTWAISNCKNLLDRVNLTHYTAGKLREILAFLHNLNYHESEKLFSKMGYSSRFDNLLYFYPVESVICPIFNKYLKVECKGVNLNSLFRTIVQNIKTDYDLGLPMKRSLFQKLLNGILNKSAKSKLQKRKESMIDGLIDLCKYICDFTILRKFLHNFKFDQVDFQRYLRRTFWGGLACSSFYDGHNMNIVLKNTFFNDMFESPEDRVKFFVKEFYINPFLKNGDYYLWEYHYSAFNFLNLPLRDNVDPLKCLRTLAACNNIQCLDLFIKWWYDSETDRISCKEKFKTSSNPSEYIYKVWLVNGPNGASMSQMFSTDFLSWLLDSEEARAQFKREKLSVVSLLHASFDNRDEIYIKPNRFHDSVQKFINFWEIDPETLNNEKEVIKSEIEDIMLKHATFYNIAALDFVMDWVSIFIFDK